MDDMEKRDMLKTVFDTMPALVFVVDADVRIREFNAAAGEVLTSGRDAVIRQRAGDILRCIHSTEVPEGCGRSPRCNECVIRNSVGAAFQGSRVVRRRARLENVRDGHTTEMYALITASPFEYEGRSLALLVIEDISEIADVVRMIPICCQCGKLRNDKQLWVRVEAYFKEHWDIDFSHSLCPDCYAAEREKVKSYVASVRKDPPGRSKTPR